MRYTIKHQGRNVSIMVTAVDDAGQRIPVPSLVIKIAMVAFAVIAGWQAGRDKTRGKTC